MQGLGVTIGGLRGSHGVPGIKPGSASGTRLTCSMAPASPHIYPSNNFEACHF